jgi:drug/metabolite transporter (DMT)-like permease
MLLALAAVWGGSFFFVEIALREVGPFTVVLHRVFWAVPALGAVLLWKGLRPAKHLKTWAAYFVMGALNNAIPFTLIVWGQTQIEGGLASILNATTAVLGAVVAGILLADERLTARKIAGAALGLAGVAAIMGPSAVSGLDLRNLGQLAILGAALSYSFASVWGKVALKGNPPEVNAFGMVTASVFIMIPLAFAIEGTPQLDLSPAVWGSLIGIAWLATALAYLLYFGILVRAGAANLMLVTLMIPPFAIGLGWAFLNESLGVEAVIGFVLIAIGLAITDGRILAKFRGKPL